MSNRKRSEARQWTKIYICVIQTEKKYYLAKSELIQICPKNRKSDKA